MEEQIIDVQSTTVEEDDAILPSQQIRPVDVTFNEDKIKSPAEIQKDLQQLKQLNKELKKIKRYMKSPLYTIRQMDARG